MKNIGTVVIGEDLEPKTQFMDEHFKEVSADYTVTADDMGGEIWVKANALTITLPPIQSGEIIVKSESFPFLGGDKGNKITIRYGGEIGGFDELNITAHETNAIIGTFGNGDPASGALGATVGCADLSAVGEFITLVAEGQTADGDPTWVIENSSGGDWF